MKTAVLAFSSLIASVFASSHFGCELVNGGASFESIATLGPLDVSSSNELFCRCSNTSVSIDFILPNGEVATNTAPIALSVAPGSVGISPTSGRLSQGVYTCRVNGMDELHAYILEGMGLVRIISNTNCRISSLSPTELILSTQLQGIPPESLVCAEDDDYPEMIDAPQIDILNRLSPTTTLLSVPFAPSSNMVRYDCNVTSTGGVTARFFCEYSSSAFTINIPSRPSLADSPQISVGSTTYTQYSQISITSISQSSPLWCQGSNPDDEISWITPQGEELAAGSISNSFGILSNPGALGLYPLASASFASGIYSCSINGEVSNAVEVGGSPSFQAPVIDSSSTCELQGKSVIVSAKVTGGLPSSISCAPTVSQTSIVPVMTSSPFRYDVSATFNPVTPGQLYTCNAVNSLGSSSAFTCSALAFPSSFRASRAESNPSTVTFSWQPPSSPLIDGYTLTILSSDRSVVETVSITSPTQNTVDVTGVDPDQELFAIISSTTSSPSTVTPASDPIPVPTVDDPASPTTNTSQCQPAEGHTVNLCLKRPLRDGEDSSSCDECRSPGFGNAAFDSVLESTCSLTSGECTSPMFIHSVENCDCKSEEKTRKKDKTHKKEKTNKRRKGNNRVGSKEKSSKPEKSKSNKGRKHMPSETVVEVCLEGTLLCGSCDPIPEAGRRKRGISRRLRFKRNKSRSKPEKSKSKAAASLIGSQGCPETLSVQGTDYEDIKLKVDRSSSFFCGNTVAIATDSCDCPESCS